MNKNDLQASEPLQPYFKSRKGICQTSLRRGVLNKICHQNFLPMSHSMRENKKITTNKLRARTTFQHVLNQEFFFGSRVVVFSRDPSRWSVGSYAPFFYGEATCKSSTVKGLLYAAKAVPSKDYFMHLTLKNARRDAEWSAPTIARHIHGASVLLGR
jgi:hypothetical protein